MDENLLLKIVEKQQLTIAHTLDQLLGIINAQGNMMAQIMAPGQQPQLQFPEEEEDTEVDSAMQGGNM